MSREELWIDAETACDAEKAGKSLVSEVTCEQGKSSRGEVKEVLKDLSELRACYDELAAETDPYPHAKVLANREEVPGSVFDDMSCFLLLAGGEKERLLFRDPSRLQEQLFRWRCQLFLLPTTTNPCLSVPPPASSGSYQWYRQHYALLDKSGISLPATWVRSIMMLYKKKLKSVWGALEAEATSVVAVREDERKQKTMMAMLGERGTEAETKKKYEVHEKEGALSHHAVCGSAARTSHTQLSNSSFAESLLVPMPGSLIHSSSTSPVISPSFTFSPSAPVLAPPPPSIPRCWKAFAPTASLPSEASPAHHSGLHYAITLQNSLMCGERKTVAEKEGGSSAPPPYFFHSVILLRQVVYAHLLQNWSVGGVDNVVEKMRNA